MQILLGSDLVTKPSNSHKCIKVSYIIPHSTPPACFGHSCSHARGDAFHRMDIPRYYRRIREPVRKCKTLSFNNIWFKMQKECYIDNIRYFYTYASEVFVTKSNCSFHGHGFFQFFYNYFRKCVYVNTVYKGEKGKAIPLQAWRGPESSRRLRLQISRQSAHEGGKVVSPMHRPPLPSGNIPGTLFWQRVSQPQGYIVRPEGLC